MDKFARIKYHSKKAWDFFWNDDSLWSWVVNIIAAFLIIRFLVYPFLGIILGTSFPIVAVVSESMEHGLHNNVLCGEKFNEFKDSFDNYWKVCGSWYEERGISKEQFSKFSFKNGFDKGDVIILLRADVDNLKIGDVLVFKGNRPQPIIHRVVDQFEENEEIYFHTKGDHNEESIKNEEKISKERLLGKGLVRIPYLGWVKILFVDAVRPFGWNIQR